MNYTETLDYMFAMLPMYQRIGAAAYKANLDNTLALCSYLGNPERSGSRTEVGSMTFVIPRSK